MQESLPDIISRVGSTTFEGVEFAHRFGEADVEETAAALDETGIVPVAVHAELPEIEEAIEGGNDLLDRCETVGCDRLITPHIAPRHFRSRDAVRDLSQRLAGIADDLDTYGIDLGYHTARFDCYPFLPEVVERLLDLEQLPNGVSDHARWQIGFRRNRGATLRSDTGLWNLFARTRPEDLFFELESAWTTVAGVDPVAVLSLFEGRVPLVHVHDVAPTGRFGSYEDARTGEGVVDFEELADTASDAGVEWLIYEGKGDRPPATKLTEGAAFLERLLDPERTATRRAAVDADD